MRNKIFAKSILVVKRIQLWFGIQHGIIFHGSTIDFDINITKAIKVNRT
jgi:hypothetical protein